MNICSDNFELNIYVAYLLETDYACTFDVMCAVERNDECMIIYVQFIGCVARKRAMMLVIILLLASSYSPEIHQVEKFCD